MDATAQAGLSSASTELLQRTLEIWQAGGPSMYAIAGVAILMCGVGVNVLLALTFGDMRPRRASTIREWIESPESIEDGGLPALARTAATSADAAAIEPLFDEYASRRLEPLESQLRVMKVCVSAAPLLGLFGTVTGMLATFDALASGTGGEQTMGAIAKGIAEALITTEAGLAVALPGVFFHYFMSQRLEASTDFLANVQSAATEALKGPTLTELA